jgi:ABC-type dipeptide/oligopeptide/nickel transport system permease subunit
VTARVEEQLDWERPARAEAPWVRGIKAILRKRVAVVCILTIFVLYGAGAYTFLDAFGVDTGLQDPNATNLSERRNTREADGQGELLSTFVDRVDVDLARLNELNPDVVEEFGQLTRDTRLPARTELFLSPDESKQGPSSRHWFGTDRAGRDLFSRALFSLRTTLIISILAVVFGNLFLGLGIGLFAGYRGGQVDNVVMRVSEVIMALPNLVFLIVLVSVFRDRWEGWFEEIEDFLGMHWLIEQGVDDYVLIIFALSFIGWAGAARFYRAQTLALREADYILAAETIGARTPRVLIRHLFPGVLPWFVLGLSASLGEIVGVEVALTFIGVGITPPTPSFGVMVANAGHYKTLINEPQILLVPMLFILPLMLAFNLLGDAINDVLNPRGR